MIKAHTEAAPIKAALTEARNVGALAATNRRARGESIPGFDVYTPVTHKYTHAQVYAMHTDCMPIYEPIVQALTFVSKLANTQGRQWALE